MRRKIVHPRVAQLHTTGIPRLPVSLHPPSIRRPPLTAWCAKGMASWAWNGLKASILTCVTPTCARRQPAN